MARTTATGRPTIEATLDDPAPAIGSTVHSVVSMARRKADTADSLGDPGSGEAAAAWAVRPARAAASAATIPAANMPSGRWAGASPSPGAASARSGRPGAGSQTTPPPVGSVSSSPSGVPSVPNTCTDSST